MEPRHRPGLFPEARYWRWWLRREGKALLMGFALLSLLAAVTFCGLSQAG